MPRIPNLLFVIADEEHARFVRPAADNTLRTESPIDSLLVRKNPLDLVSDPIGASCHTGESAHHSLESRHDMHVLEKGKFARTVGLWLDTAGAAEAFEELVIVAPPHTLAAIRDRLNSGTHARIVGTLPKDLVKVPDDELWPHLHWWIRPTCRTLL